MHTCVTCSKAFKYQQQLAQHAFNAHGEDLQFTFKEKCKICNKVFFKDYAYMQHMQSKHKGPFLCFFCNPTAGHVLQSVAEVQEHMNLLLL